VPAIKNSSCAPRGEAFQLAFCSGDLKNQLLGRSSVLAYFYVSRKARVKFAGVDPANLQPAISM
jgi:hypothetical protein